MSDDQQTSRGSGTKGRHNSRASLACSRCKAAKRRCDYPAAAGLGESDSSKSCTLCKAKNVKCDVRIEDDRRRGKHRERTKDLRSRLEALEDLVRNGDHQKDGRSDSSPRVFDSTMSDDANDDGYAVPAVAEVTVLEETDPVEMQGGHPGNSNDAVRQQRTTVQQPSPGISAASASPGFGISGMGSLNETFACQPPHPFPNQLRPLTNASPGAHASRDSSMLAGSTSTFGVKKSSAALSDTSPSVLEEVTARAGDLKGSNSRGLQYFGATSIFYHARHQEALILNENPNSHQRSRRMSAAAIDADIEPGPIVTHLLDLFFEWQTAHLNVVDREMFMLHRRLYDENDDYDDRNFYSPALLHAMMSLASLISPDRGVRRYSSIPDGKHGEAFLRKARQLLDLEVHSPSTTTVQAGLLIASWYGAVGQTSLGWMYSGLTFRMCYELGMHLDCSESALRGDITKEVMINRERIFWGCYTQDKLWSAYCGRPSFFMDWDITVNPPDKWTAQSAQQQPANDVSSMIREGIVYLSQRCSEILLNLYSQRNSSKLSDLLQFATRVHKKLYEWREQLSADLDWPRSDTAARPYPGVLILHMQFYFTLILVHRPLLHISDAQRAIAMCDKGPIPLAAVCSLAATNIAKLVRDYQQFYCLQKISSPAVHFTFIAATIHLVDFRLFKAQKHHFLLQGCMSALMEMGQSYPIGQKAVAVLQNMMERWKPHENAWQKDHQPPRPEEKEDLLRLYSKFGFINNDRQHPLDLDDSLAMEIPGADFNDGFNIAADLPMGAFPFDWSVYNSPIEVPPLFDASMIPMPEISVEETAASIGHTDDFQSRPSADGNCRDRPGRFNGPVDFWDSFNETTLADFYGTSFALMNSG